jgi:hypothetical protein
MKKYIGIAILLCASLFAQAESTGINFSVGTIGGSWVANPGETFGTINGSLIDIYGNTPIENLGFEFSPFNYAFEFHGLTVSGNIDYTILNASLYYEAIRPYGNAFVGPFARINWLDFKDNRPSFAAGLRLCARDALEFDLFGKKVSYGEPVLFNYVNVELGYLRKSGKNNVYLGASVDASLLGAMILFCSYESAEENTKKHVPDYKERLPEPRR